MRCKNDSPCKTTTSTLNGKQTLVAECVCKDSFIGRQCEAWISIATSSVTSNMVDVSVSFHTNNNASNNKNLRQLKYSLQYWSNETENICVIIQNVETSSYRVHGLHAGMRYNMCARTDTADWCVQPDSHISVTATNCISIVTSVTPLHTSSSHAGIIVGVVIVVIISLSAVIIYVLKRKNYIRFQTCMDFNILSVCNRSRHAVNERQGCLISQPQSTSSTAIKRTASPSKKGADRSYASYSTKDESAVALMPVKLKTALANDNVDSNLISPETDAI